MPSDERNTDRASDRQHERAEHVENILDETESLVREDQKFPVRSEELAEAYGDQPIDLPNETESLGSVFDRLDEKYENAEEVREAVYGEVTGEAGGPEEYNEERDLRALDRAEGDDTRNAVEGEETTEGAAATFGENDRGPDEDRVSEPDWNRVAEPGDEGEAEPLSEPAEDREDDGESDPDWDRASESDEDRERNRER